jgi:hypothetical protein
MSDRGNESVKWFNENKGSGFITKDSDGKNIFVRLHLMDLRPYWTDKKSVLKLNLVRKVRKQQKWLSSRYG